MSTNLRSRGIESQRSIRPRAGGDRRGGQRALWLLLVPLVGMVLVAGCPLGAASAAPASALPSIQLTYRGGPLIQNVKVVTLFWGSSWSRGSLPGYYNGFFRALFADGRFMANMAQYSAGGYQIGNGSFGGTDTDTQNPSAKVTDAQIRSEIRAQIAAGHLPKPDEDAVYVVFTPPGAVVYDRYGGNSARDFDGYHDYDFGNDGFAYVVIPFDNSPGGQQWMTATASHELAEAVTDPEPSETTLGWYDDDNGEIGDIPVSLYVDNLINVEDLIDELDASDGTAYLVQKVWSLQAKGPVAFAGG
jgi:hypothetical protein